MNKNGTGGFDAPETTEMETALRQHSGELSEADINCPEEDFTFCLWRISGSPFTYDRLPKFVDDDWFVSHVGQLPLQRRKPLFKFLERSGVDLPNQVKKDGKGALWDALRTFMLSSDWLAELEQLINSSSEWKRYGDAVTFKSIYEQANCSKEPIKDAGGSLPLVEARDVLIAHFDVLKKVAVHGDTNQLRDLAFLFVSCGEISPTQLLSLIEQYPSLSSLKEFTDHIRQRLVVELTRHFFGLLSEALEAYQSEGGNDLSDFKIDDLNAFENNPKLKAVYDLFLRFQGEVQVLTSGILAAAADNVREGDFRKVGKTFELCRLACAVLSAIPQWSSEAKEAHDKALGILGSVAERLGEESPKIQEAISALNTEPWTDSAISSVEKFMRELEDHFDILESAVNDETELLRSLTNGSIAQRGANKLSLDEKSDIRQTEEENFYGVVQNIIEFFGDFETGDIKAEDVREHTGQPIDDLDDAGDDGEPEYSPDATELDTNHVEEAAVQAPVAKPSPPDPTPKRRPKETQKQQPKAEVAALTPEGEPILDEQELVRDLVGDALGTQYQSFSIYAMKAFEDRYPDHRISFNHTTILLGLLGLSSIRATGPMGREINQLIGKNTNLISQINWGKGADHRCATMFILAGTIPSALCVSLTDPNAADAIQLLLNEEVFGGATSLYELAAHVLDARSFGQDLGLEGLALGDSSGPTKKTATTLREEAKNRTQKKNYTHKGTIAVWNRWVFDHSSIIGNALKVIRDGQPNAITIVREAVAETDNPGKCIDRTVDQLNQRGKITGRYRRALIHELEALNDLFLRFVRHQKARTSDKSTYFIESKTTYCRKLLSLIDNAIVDLRSEELSTSCEFGAAGVLIEVLNETKNIISGNPSEPTTFSFKDQLQCELALIPNITSSGNILPAPGDASVILEMIPNLLSSLPSEPSEAYKRAISDRVEEDRFIAARLLRISLAKKLSSTSIDGDSDELRQSLISARRDLRARLAEAREMLSLAIATEIVNESERQGMEINLSAIDTEKLPREVSANEVEEIIEAKRQPILDICDAAQVLKDTVSHLQGLFDQEITIQGKKIRLLQEKGELSARKQEALEQLLNDRNFIALRESIRYLEQGRKLPDRDNITNVHEAFSRDFLSKVTKEYRTKRDQFVPDALAALKGKTNPVSSLIPNNFSDAQRTQAAELIGNWSRALSRAPRFEEAIPRVIEQGLGFTLMSSIDLNDQDRSKSRAALEFSVSTETVALPDHFVAPRFGADAKNRFQFVLISPKSSSATTNVIEQTLSAYQGTTTPTIILTQTIMLTEDRIKHAETNRRRKYASLVVDNVLLVFLALRGGRHNRLTDFFYATMPYMSDNPYDDVDPMAREMFYGRAEAKREILDLRSSSLIYGGRRFGKSALLLDVVRNEHNPKNGFFVVLLNLHSNTSAVPLDAAWASIANALRDSGLTVANNIKTRNGVFKAIKANLKQDKNNRLLLLIDEADNFIETDETEHGYDNVNALSNLMKETDRRFKVVFAGINNVQRMANTPNHSFGFLGNPIAIGPFVSNDDIAEARRLVTEPLAALGYRFENPLYPLRILAQVYYYPSLIQLYCRQILKRLQAKPIDDLRPRRISAEDIEMAYKENELHDAIQTRINLTLQMDDRHRMLAYLLANNYHDIIDGGGTSVGMTAGQIFEDLQRETAVFGDGLNINQVQSLLEEMEHLGLLSRVQSRYQFRSVGLVMMLGDKDTVEAELVNFQLSAGWAGHRKTDRTAERRALDPNNQFERSPVDATQEQRLFFDPTVRVGILTGLMPNDEELLHRSIQSFGVIESGYAKNGPKELHHLLNSIEFHFGKETTGIRHLFMISSQVPWQASWLPRIIDTCKKFEHKDARVLLIADGSHVKDLIEEPYASGELIVETVPWWTDKALEPVIRSAGLQSMISSPDDLTKILETCGGHGSSICSLLEELSSSGETLEELLPVAREAWRRNQNVRDYFCHNPDEFLKKKIEELAEWCPLEVTDGETVYQELFEEVFGNETMFGFTPNQFFEYFSRVGLFNASTTNIEMRPSVVDETMT